MERVERDGVVRYESALLRYRGIVHGFGVRDVAIATYALAVGCDPARIPTTHQVHGSVVHVMDGTSSGPFIGDGYCTRAKGIVLHIRTADCLPILWCDPVSGVVGAIHAGWRGLAERVISATIAAAVERLSVHRSTLSVAIGPAMGPACYEVSEDVIARLSRSGHDIASVTVPSRNADRWLLDLPEVAVAELLQNGIPRRQIARADLCTHCRTDDFHSFRRAPETSGRQESFIALA